MTEADYKALDARLSNLEDQIKNVAKATGLLGKSIKSIIAANRMMLDSISELKAQSEQRPTPRTGPK